MSYSDSEERRDNVLITRGYRRTLRKPTTALLELPALCDGLNGSIIACSSIKYPTPFGQVDSAAICKTKILYKIYSHIEWENKCLYHCRFLDLEDRVWMEESMLCKYFPSRLIRYLRLSITDHRLIGKDKQYNVHPYRKDVVPIVISDDSDDDFVESTPKRRLIFKDESPYKHKPAPANLRFSTPK